MDASHLTGHQVPPVNGTADLPGCPAVSLADTLLSAALAYAERGWPVFPCEAGGKRPVPVHGFKDAVSDADRIREWWHGRPFNIGVSTGAPGPDVLDVDVRPDGNGWAAFNRLKAAGFLSGSERLVRTPSGGAHLYFHGTDQRCGSLKAERLDWKSRGGYVVCPPSVVAGRSYELVDDRPATGRVLDWQAARALLCPPRPVPVRGSFRRGPGSAKHLVRWLQGQAEGNRNGGLFWAAREALRAGDEAVIDDLAAVALSAGLGEDEVRKTIGSAYREVNGDAR